MMPEVHVVMLSTTLIKSVFRVDEVTEVAVDVMACEEVGEDDVDEDVCEDVSERVEEIRRGPRGVRGEAGSSFRAAC